MNESELVLKSGENNEISTQIHIQYLSDRKKNVDPVAMGGHHFMCALKNVDALYAILFTIL